MSLAKPVPKFTLPLLLFALAVTKAQARAVDTRLDLLQARVAKLEALTERLVEENRLLTVALGTTSGHATQPVAFRQTEPLPVSVPDPVTLPVRSRELPQELLPGLGKIGAVASFSAAWNGGAFGLGGGSYVGGSVELPLAKVPKGRLSYEFSVGLAQSSKMLATTSNVAQVANLAALATLRPTAPGNLNDALLGTGAAPFAVSQTARWKAQTVQIVPFALKYHFTQFDRWRFRPFAVVGLGTYVTTSRQTASTGLRLDSTLDDQTKAALQSTFANAPFAGALIGGQVSSSKELQSQGLPSGQGGTDLGIHSGAGIDWLFASGLTLGIDARFNSLPGGTTYRTVGARWAWRF